MCDQSEINYLDGDVVWVKLGNCWWPGEVVGPEKLPPDVLPSFRKPPIAVVKFYQEDTYEYVKNLNSIYRYNCSRKNEFINKGLYMYRTKHGQMDKFPEDVIRAETAVGGDIKILTRDEFQEVKKESYAGLFGGPTKKTPSSIKKGKNDRGSLSATHDSSPANKLRHKTNYKVHILVQETKTQAEIPEATVSPSTSRAGSEPLESPSEKEEKLLSETKFDTPTMSSPGIYACHACPFTTSRLNVLIMHNKTHSTTFTPYTPSPVKKKTVIKMPKSTPNIVKSPKVRKPKQEKDEKPIKKHSRKRTARDVSSVDNKKSKTDDEIKTSLLADWDDVDEDSNDESTVNVMAGSPEVPVAAQSPAIPTPAELPSAIEPTESIPPPPPQELSTVDNTDSANDAKYEFREDEDWPIEADMGRKIPRVKNSSKRRDDSKSIDEDEMAREVAELLNKTALPELPSAPEPLKVEANFPEPSVVKSPDKKQGETQNQNHPIEKKNVADTQPTRTIFKTKTFFRSRHSRSQDAIGKYVAEQLNAAERMDLSENDLNGSETVPSPEPRISPPIEHVKVARLAPKIQLKKMKAEAAQLLEKEQRNARKNTDDYSYSMVLNPEQSITSSNIAVEDKKKADISVVCNNVHSDTSPILSNKNTENQTLDTAEERNGANVTSQNEDNEMVTKLKESASLANPNKSILPLNKNVESYETFMTESTASAVDALLSVSRETDRVTKVISDDPPEDLFEDDNKILNSVNGFSIDTYEENNSNIKEVKVLNLKECENSQTEKISVDNGINKENIHTVNEHLSIGENSATNHSVEKTSIDTVETQGNFISTIENNPVENVINEPVKIISKVSESINVIPENGNTVLENESLISTNTHLPEMHVISENICSVSKRTYEISDVTDLKSKNTHTISENTQMISKNIEMSEITENQHGISDQLDEVTKNTYLVSENLPTESDLQVAEALINLPTTSIHNKINVEVAEDEATDTKYSNIKMTEEETTEQTNIENVDTIGSSSVSDVIETKSRSSRFETEEEKSENLNAAQSLVQMSETIDHKHSLDINSIKDNERRDNISAATVDDNEVTSTSGVVAQNVTLGASDKNGAQPIQSKSLYEPNSSKLLKILEEPSSTKHQNIKKTVTKQVIVTGKEKILNFEAGCIDQSLKSKPTKQKIIIRRTTPTKNLLNSMTEATSSDKIILSPCKKTNQEPSSVQTYTIQTTPEVTSDSNTIIIQPKIRKITKPLSKVQKIKTQSSFVSSVTDTKATKVKSCTDAMFDINSMPIVLSDDILTPESIEKMPFVMSDGNFITSTNNPPKLIKTKQTILNNEKVPTSANNKTEVKTVLVNASNEGNKVTTPNILSKSSKPSRGAKPLLVIDKNTGKQKIIMTKSEQPIKEIKQPHSILPAVTQTTKTEKFIILPTQHNSPRPTRTQKIVIDPQTGKAHMLVGKGPEMTSNVTDNKPVSAKLIPSASDANTPGNTVMIITNAQGAQSRIVLTPEHEKILFPNKQQQNVLQLKPANHRPSSSNGAALKTIVSAGAPIKTQTRIVQKQKGAIITSKGQLIVGGRIATSSQSIAPLPEIRPAPKRIIATEPKKLVQAIQKNATEPLIFLQQKNGTVMQLTVAQFEHLQRTGQIVQKPSEKIVVQKSLTITNETAVPTIQKQRVRKQVTESSTPPKKVKHEIAIAPAPSPTPIPALTPLTNTIPSIAPSITNTVTSIPATNYSDLDNFEELLPSTAIARQPEIAPAPAPTAAPAPVDGQLVAIPGENFGGPPGTFYLCVEDGGTLTPIDNRPLVLENNQLVPMSETLPVLAPQPERRDILEAALANSDVFHAEPSRDDAPDFRDLNANVSVHCRVSETSTTLNQPIMTPIEVPSKVDSEPTTVPSNLEDGLAVIGVIPQTVPTSLELPITVTDPRIAPKTTDPLSNNNYRSAILPSPNTEMTFVTTEETNVSIVGPISMPLLTEDDSVGKSMPILTDDITDRTVSSVESVIGSPSSVDIRESEAEEGMQWSRRFLTPGSDTSETSAEIPLQPAMQLSSNDLSQSS